MMVFPSDARNFTEYGYGPLPDALSAVVREEINGAFTLDMLYPFDGFNGDKLQPGNIIFCKARPSDTRGEPFRIYETIDGINRTVQVRANHISYDANYEVFYGQLNTTVTGIRNACDALNNYRWGNGFIRVWFDGIDEADPTTFDIGSVKMLSEALSGKGSLLEAFGGQYRYEYRSDLDREVVYLCARRGVDREISISYAYNMTDFSRDRNNATQVSTIVAYVERDNNGVTERAYETFALDPSAPIVRRMLINVSSMVAWGATRAQIEAAVAEILQGADVTKLMSAFAARIVPSIQFGIDDTKLDLGDTVKILFAELNVNVRLMICKAAYTVLTDHYDSVDLGDQQTDVADTIAKLEEDSWYSGKVRYV